MLEEIISTDKVEIMIDDQNTIIANLKDISLYV